MNKELETKVHRMNKLLAEQKWGSEKGNITITVAQAVDIRELLLELLLELLTSLVTKQ